VSMPDEPRLTPSVDAHLECLLLAESGRRVSRASAALLKLKQTVANETAPCPADGSQSAKDEVDDLEEVRRYSSNCEVAVRLPAPQKEIDMVDARAKRV
jgi:hypothetical protein